MSLSIGASSVQASLLNNYSRAAGYTSQASERLATSRRINHASDDPAGLIAAEDLQGDLIDSRASIRSTEAKQRQLSVQQSGRQLATGVLRDIRGLLVEASDGFTSDQQQQAIQSEVDSSLDALDYLGSITGFSVSASLEQLREGGSASVSQGAAASGVEVVEAELAAVTKASAAAGAYEKYTLEVDKRLAEDRAVATAAALSEIADADYVSEATNLVKGGILTEASTRLMALQQDLQRQQSESLFAIL